MGPGKYEWYKQNKSLQGLIGNYPDSVFGDMPVVKPLWALQGFDSYADKLLGAKEFDINEWVNYLENISAEEYDNIKSHGKEVDLLLHKIGKDGPPTIVGPDKFNELLEKGDINKIIYRGQTPGDKGLTVAKQIEIYKSEEGWWGEGYIGNGLYFSEGKAGALNYAGGRNDWLLKVGLKSDAKVGNVWDIIEEYQSAVKSDPLIKRAFKDVSEYAISKGYDATCAPGRGYYIIFNRGATITTP